MQPSKVPCIVFFESDPFLFCCMAGRRGGLFGTSGSASDAEVALAARGTRYVTEEELHTVKCWLIGVIIAFVIFSITITVAYISRSVIDAHDITKLEAATSYARQGSDGASVVLDAAFLALRGRPHGLQDIVADVIVPEDDVGRRRAAPPVARDLGGMLILGPGENRLYYEHIVATLGAQGIASSIILRPPGASARDDGCAATPGFTIARTPPAATGRRQAGPEVR